MASNPMDRTMDLARIKDIHAAKEANARHVDMVSREVQQVKAAAEASHQATLAFLHSALAGIDARIDMNDDWRAALRLQDNAEVARLRERVYQLEHPWRTRWARVRLWWQLQTVRGS